jgi:hypothetical protein
MTKTFKLLSAVGVAGVVAASGSTFTASNTVGGDNYAGYGSATVTGAITQAIEHTLSADGTTINSTVLTFTTDLTAGHQVEAGFGTTALESCAVTLNATPTLDTATCTYAAAGYTTSTATDFRVAVS